MSLSSYLASKYLTADTPSSSKKRKRKNPSSSSGLIIADDDALGWSATTATRNDDDDVPLAVNSGSAEFRKSKKNAWKVVGTPAPKASDLEDSAAADAIIASAAAENAASAHLDEEPTIEDDSNIVKMSDGTHAGLQTAAAVSAQMAKRKAAELAEWEAEQAALGHKKGKGKREEETVYRDATGRRIDISMRRAEARREADALAAKEKAEKEAQLGDVQRAQKAQRKEQLEEARFMPLARTIEDEDLNRELKSQQRWNDPAAQFMKTKEEGRSVTGKPVYKGPAPPNRYGIRPGYRWDGVDRGNGWEAERFKAQNRRGRLKELDFAWQTDE